MNRFRPAFAAFALTALLSACASPVRPWRPPPLPPPAEAPASIRAVPPFTALEAIQRARRILSTDSRDIWLITAEARPEPTGGRLGAAREWVMLFRQLNGPILRVTVLAAGEVVTAELPGSNWEGGRRDRFRIDPGLVRHDSHWAIRIADAVGGAAFIAQYPGSQRSIVLDHGMGEPLTWTIEYQTPDNYYTLTYIIEDATGRILHIARCEFTPAAMARPGLPNCARDFEVKDPPVLPPVESSLDWGIV